MSIFRYCSSCSLCTYGAMIAFAGACETGAFAIQLSSCPLSSCPKTKQVKVNIVNFQNV